MAFASPSIAKIVLIRAKYLGTSFIEPFNWLIAFSQVLPSTLGGPGASTPVNHVNNLLTLRLPAQRFQGPSGPRAAHIQS